MCITFLQQGRMAMPVAGVKLQIKSNQMPPKMHCRHQLQLMHQCQDSLDKSQTS